MEERWGGVGWGGVGWGGVGWGGVESGSKGQRSWGWGVRLKVLEVGWRVVVTN